MDMDRVSAFDPAEQVLVKRKRQLRVQTALEQDLGTSQGQSLFDLLAQDLPVQYIGLRRIGSSIKGAKTAARKADIGIIDVPVHHIGNHRFRMQLPADLLSGLPESQEVRRIPI